MKRCPACGQDNPDIFTHCEWCGRSLKTAKNSAELDTQPTVSADVPTEKKRPLRQKKQSNGIFLKTLVGLGVTVLSACLLFLCYVFRLNFLCVIPACLVIIAIYLLNCFPAIFFKKGSQPTKGKRLILSLISLLLIAAAVGLLYLSIITA